MYKLLLGYIAYCSKYADNPTDVTNRLKFIESFNGLAKLEKRSWDRVSHALSYCFPDVYIALSRPNRNILRISSFLDSEVYNSIKDIKLEQIDGSSYLRLIDQLRNNSTSISKLSYIAYKIKNIISVIDKNDTVSLVEKINSDDDISKTIYGKELVNFIKRDYKVRKEVLERDEYTCKCCGTKNTFERKDGKQYMEVHHLIPISNNYNEFDAKGKKLDNKINMICICPQCHRAFHYGKSSVLKCKLNEVKENIDSMVFKDYYKIEEKIFLNFIKTIR